MFLLLLIVAITLVVILSFLVFHLIYKLPSSKDASFFSNIIVGHRGSKHPDLDIPENSIQSMRFAIDHKADGIEIDIMLSKDGVPMVFHDTNRVSRLCQSQKQTITTRTKHITGSGEEVEEETTSVVEGSYDTEIGIPFMTRKQIQSQFEYIRGQDANTIKKLFPDCRLAFPAHIEHSIPTLDEFVDDMFARDPTKVLMIEIKEYERSKEMADYIIKTFKKYPHLYKQSVVASFNPVVLYMVRRMDAKIVTNLLFKEGFLGDWMKYDPNVHKSKDYPVFLEELHKGYYKGSLDTPMRLLYSLFLSTLSFWDWILLKCMVYWLPSFIGAGVLGFENKMAFDIDFVRSLQKRGYKVNVWVVNTMQQKKQLLSVGDIAITTDYLFDYSPKVYNELPQSMKNELSK